MAEGRTVGDGGETATRHLVACAGGGALATWCECVWDGAGWAEDAGARGLHPSTRSWWCAFFLLAGLGCIDYKAWDAWLCAAIRFLGVCFHFESWFI